MYNSITFQSCFISLVIERVLEYRLGYNISTKQIAASLSSINGVQLPNTNAYMFSYYDDALDKIGKEFGIDFAWVFRRAIDINSMIAKLKKS